MRSVVQRVYERDSETPSERTRLKQRGTIDRRDLLNARPIHENGTIAETGLPWGRDERDTSKFMLVYM